MSPLHDFCPKEAKKKGTSDERSSKIVLPLKSPGARFWRKKKRGERVFFTKKRRRRSQLLQGGGGGGGEEEEEKEKGRERSQHKPGHNIGGLAIHFDFEFVWGLFPCMHPNNQACDIFLATRDLRHWSKVGQSISAPAPNGKCTRVISH